MSEQPTCRIFGLSRRSPQYRSAPKDANALQVTLVQLAKRHRSYCYRKTAELLRFEGWKANHEKVERLWREEGLQQSQRKKRRRLYHKDSSIICLRLTHPDLSRITLGVPLQ
jgi:putative transposase